MNEMPYWAETIIYWLHMLATVVAFGSLVALLLLVIPTAEKTLDEDAQVKFLDALQARLDSLIWFCFFLLLATGMFQLSLSPNYKGLLSMQNKWEIAILTKHALVLLAATVTAVISWGIFPAIRRAKIRAKKTGVSSELIKLRKRQKTIMYFGLVLLLLILLATAAARAA